MELIKYQRRPQNWNELIKGFDTKTLFHETFWHDHILSIHSDSRIEYFWIEDNNVIVGYFCGMVIRKLFLKIMGSPLGGTGTNYMGPIVNKDIDQQDLISSIERMCKRERITHFEISNDFLNSEVMERLGFNKHPSVTHKLEIAETEEEAFKRLLSVCRNRIRKAKKNNLLAEIATDPSIVGHFFEQFKEVYGKQDMVTPFGESRVKSLYDSLVKKKTLLPIWVKMGDKVIATGLFPYDERAIYFWGGTSWLQFQKFCPNEMLHWTVIKFAIKNRIREYNMCGGGSQFKNKFGGADVEYITYSKSYLPLLKYLREIYNQMHFFQLKIKGKLKNLFS
jgi:hypothetical protein